MILSRCYYKSSLEVVKQLFICHFSKFEFLAQNQKLHHFQQLLNKLIMTILTIYNIDNL